MNLIVKEENNKEIWEKFLFGCSEKTFLNSWNWGEFQKKEGNKIWRIGIYDNQELIGIALTILIKARRGSFLFVPHGPNIKTQNYSLKFKVNILSNFFNQLRIIAKKEKVDFIRVAPIWQRNEENNKIFKDLKFREAPIHIHPETTWELDISFSEEELLKGMRKTTRYLIRRAEKNKDIKIIKTNDINNLEEFYKIYKRTAQRHKFSPFSLNYLKNEFSSFSQDNQILVFLGEYKDKIVSSAIIVFWQNMAFYHHGASLPEYSDNKTPVSYLIQWEAIKEAKRQGCRLYNFWGIAPFSARAKKNCYSISDGDLNRKLQKLNKKHPWYGLTIFKMGFGGYSKEYVKTQDFLLSLKYCFNYIIEKARRIKRGL